MTDHQGLVLGLVMTYLTGRWFVSLWINRRLPSYTYWWEAQRRQRRHSHERG